MAPIQHLGIPTCAIKTLLVGCIAWGWHKLPCWLLKIHVEEYKIINMGGRNGENLCFGLWIVRGGSVCPRGLLPRLGALFRWEADHAWSMWHVSREQNVYRILILYLNNAYLIVSVLPFFSCFCCSSVQSKACRHSTIALQWLKVVLFIYNL